MKQQTTDQPDTAALQPAGKGPRSVQLITTLLICAMAVGLILHVIMPDKAWSQAENRPLQALPALSISELSDASITADLDSYWSDQMPGRETFFHINYLLKKYTGTTLLNGVYLCKDRLIGQPVQARSEIWQNNLQWAADFCRQNDLPGILAVVPSASVILENQLPWQATTPDEAFVLEQIRQLLPQDEDGSSLLSCLDLTTILSQEATHNLYYKTDHHWTSYGAGLAGMAFLDIRDAGTQHSLDQYQFMPVSHSFEGTLANKTGSIFLSDTIDIAPSADNPQYMVTWADGTTSASIYDMDALDQKDQYQLFLGANQSVVRIDTTNTNGRNLLLFKDSYANSMIQFLLPYYQSIIIVDPRYYYEDLDLLFSMNDITEAAFVFGYDNFVSDSSLKDVLSTSDALAQALELEQQSE